MKRNWVGKVCIVLKSLRVGFSKRGSLKGTVRLRLSLRRQLLTNLPVGQNLYQTNILGDLRVSLLSYAYYVIGTRFFLLCAIHERHSSYTGCHRRNGPNFGRVFLMLNYTDITQNTYIQS